MKNYEQIERAASQIETVALMMQAVAETGSMDFGKEVEDLAELIAGKATEIRHLLQDEWDAEQDRAN